MIQTVKKLKKKGGGKEMVTNRLGGVVLFPRRTERKGEEARRRGPRSTPSGDEKIRGTNAGLGGSIGRQDAL